jgi:hypothetical protein
MSATVTATTEAQRPGTALDSWRALADLAELDIFYTGTGRSLPTILLTPVLTTPLDEPGYG